MAIKRKTFNQGLVAMNPTLCTDFYTLKGNKKTATDFVSYTATNALTDLNDVKTNNYSNVFLTKLDNVTNWLEMNPKLAKKISFVSTLNFHKVSTPDLTRRDVWLYFDKSEMLPMADDVPSKLSEDRADQTYDYYFGVEIVNETECKISHLTGEYTYYLGANSSSDIGFIREGDDDRCRFKYSMSNGKIRLYKKQGNELYTLSYIENDEGGYQLRLTNGNVETDDTTLYITSVDTSVPMDNAWVGYDRSKSVSEIDLNKSAFHLKSQAMFHHQYSNPDGLNFVILKNNVTYNGSYTRGNNLSNSSDEYPDVNFRNYTNLNTGLNQELGQDNVILTYQFTDQVYTLEDGAVFEWRIPSAEENNGSNPLWPYKTLNIKDSKLRKNGAFASDVPYFADKVYHLLGNKSAVTKSPNNGTYLCTWLYQPDEKMPSKWLDRYYYPDRASRAQALSGAHFAESFENMLDKNYTSTSTRENSYFDKVSDLVFEADNTYRYARLSSAMVNDVLTELEPYRIRNVVDKNDTFTYLSDQMILDGTNHLRIRADQFNKTNAINLNFDLHITEKIPIGLQIFGSDYNSGLTIQNRKDLAPYHYYATSKIVYLMNNEFKITHQFDLYTKYQEEILRFIMGDIFDDVIIIAENSLYVLTWDLTLKANVAYADMQNKNLLGEEPSVTLSEYPGLIYKNNLYVPHDSQILKIIFVPDSPADDFPESDVTRYPCRIRSLSSSEFYSNFSGGGGSSGPTLEDSFVETESKFKEIYIDKEGKIYGFNFDQLAVSPDGDTVYGLYGLPSYIEVGGWFWIYNQSLSKLIKGDTSAKFMEFGSIESIDFMKMNEYGMLCLVRGFASLSENRRIEIYDMAKQRFYQHVLDNYCEVYSLDAIRYIDINNEEHVSFVLIAKEGDIEVPEEEIVEDETTEDEETEGEEGNEEEATPEPEEPPVETPEEGEGEEEGTEPIPETPVDSAPEEPVQLVRIEYQCDTKKFFEEDIKIPEVKLATFRETTNSNVILRYANTNKLYFNLYLPNAYLQNYHECIEWDLANAQTGWYNINVEVDLDAAEFNVKINDVEYSNADKSTNYMPYVHSNGNIFDMTYYVGSLGKKYGTSMHRILYDEIEDRYSCRNSIINNTKIFTKRLAYHEFQAMRLEGHRINTITITLPTGQRSNIDEIVRYFKYVPPTAISNKVKINISGTGLTTKGEFDLLEKEIRQRLEDEKDCLVDVNQIEFV